MLNEEYNRWSDEQAPRTLQEIEEYLHGLLQEHKEEEGDFGQRPGRSGEEA